MAQKLKSIKWKGLAATYTTYTNLKFILNLYIVFSKISLFLFKRF